MEMKKLLLLGGSRYLMPVIKTAHELGCHVITCDYLPDNYAHRFADEYCNISIIDKDAVLAKARELKIDGIMSFACDPGVVTAAYVADKMGLPSPPFHSVEILQDKGRFRDFLEKNRFNCPWHRVYASKEEALADSFDFPAIVKPVDSAGSKGCSRVNSLDELSEAVDYAIRESHSGKFIIEQFLELVGHQSGSDSFSIDNELVFCSFDSQYFDPQANNPYTPCAHIWPSDIPLATQNELQGEIQRLIRLLDMGTTLYNIEVRIAQDGKPYLMEVSPRGGGNRLAEILNFATGQDLILSAVMASIGQKCSCLKPPKYDGCWVDYVVHAPKTGFLQEIAIKPDFQKSHVRMADFYVQVGSQVKGFSGANQALGHVFLRFDSYEEAKHAVMSPEKWLQVQVA